MGEAHESQPFRLRKLPGRAAQSFLAWSLVPAWLDGGERRLAKLHSARAGALPHAEQAGMPP